MALSCVNFEWNRDEIFDISSTLIRDILDNRCKVTDTGNGYTIIHLLELLWQLRLSADKYDMTSIRDNLDKLITKKPDAVTDENWRFWQERLEKKK